MGCKAGPANEKGFKMLQKDPLDRLIDEFQFNSKKIRNETNDFDIIEKILKINKMQFTDILKNLPEVKPPVEKKLSFNIKLKWTIIILVAFFVMANISLYGLFAQSDFLILYYEQIAVFSTSCIFIQLMYGLIT